jgi:hypothetical protein
MFDIYQVWALKHRLVTQKVSFFDIHSISLYQYRADIHAAKYSLYTKPLYAILPISYV